jgi:hypothetical protein
MPRLPKDYSKNVIYKLVCNDLNILGCYVGHTTDFTRRKQRHKSDCNSEKGEKYNFKVYKTIRENGGWDNYSMIEVEKYPCRDENEATSKEREWFERLNSNLNTQHPNRSRQEYKRQHYIDNREESLIKMRQYNKDHKEEILIQQRQHYADHKEEIATRRKQTFTCECGRVTTWGNKSNHLKTKFHLQYMERIMSSTDSTIPDMTIEDDADTQLVHGICYIPLAQFENIKQQKEINDDHFYFSNHYDFMHHQ